MAHASPISSPATAPTLVSIGRSVHQALASDPVPRVIYIHQDAAAESFDLGFWELPDAPGHPVSPLVGFVAPPDWDAIGVSTTGRMRHLDRPDDPPIPVVTTVLLGRDGETASLFGPATEPPTVLDGPPVGLVPDVLARVLRRPTPPPEYTAAALVELTWLDRIASGVLSKRSAGRSWRWLADRHPLRGGGPPPPPDELAERTAAYREQRSWADLRLLGAAEELPAARWGPPGGVAVPPGTWFDDGSLARWTLGALPPPEPLLADVLSVLPPVIRAELAAALVELEAPPDR